MLVNITDITFIYDTKADMCFIQKSDKSVQELTIKGPIERNSEIIGTWFQVNQQANHWISFRKNQYRLNTWEAFYKCASNSEIKYYRQVFYQPEIMLIFSFSEKDEWIKDPISGKWRSKF